MYVAPLATPMTKERRTASAPVYAEYAANSRPLPSIFENSPDGQPRIVSAPPHRNSAALPTPNDHKNLDFLARTENTIRVVQSPSAINAAENSIVPRPLNVRKKSAQSAHGPSKLRKELVDREEEIRKKYSFHSQMEALPEGRTCRSNSNGSSVAAKKKLSGWFRRVSRSSSKDGVDEAPDTTVADHDQARALPQPPQRFASTSTGAGPPPMGFAQASKKKSFMFWKASKTDNRMSIAGKHTLIYYYMVHSVANMSSSPRL